MSTGQAMADPGELTARLARAVDRTTRVDRAAAYLPPGVALVAWLAPFPAALALIVDHPDAAARMEGLAWLALRAEGDAQNEAALRRELVEQVKALPEPAEDAAAFTEAIARAPLADGRVYLAARARIQKAEHPFRALAEAALALSLRAAGDDAADLHQRSAAAYWQDPGPHPHRRGHVAAQLGALLARWHMGSGDAARANALLDEALALQGKCLVHFKGSFPLVDALAAAGRFDEARRCVEEGYGGLLALIAGLARASRTGEAEALARGAAEGPARVMALCALSQARAAEAPGEAAALLAEARAGATQEVLDEMYQEGLITAEERARAPQEIAWTAWRLGREGEAREALAAIDRGAREDVRRAEPPAPGEDHAGAPPEDPWAQAGVDRGALDGLRAMLRAEVAPAGRTLRPALRRALKLAAALARTERDLGRALLDEARAALARFYGEEGLERRYATRFLVDALLAHGRLDEAASMLERADGGAGRAAQSAALVRALLADGRRDDAARALSAAVDAIADRAAAVGLIPAAGALLGPEAEARLRAAVAAADAALEASALP